MIKYFHERILLRKFHKQDEQRTKELVLLNQLWTQLAKGGVTKYDKLLNACIYVSLTNRDIYYLAEYFYWEKRKFRKNFFGRLLSMTIVEYLDDINFLLGKELTDELKSNQMPEFLEPIKLLNKLYADWKNQFSKDLRAIRNEASAHKTKDAKELLKICNELPILNLGEIGYEMGKMESAFNFITTKMFEQIPWSIKKDV